MPLDLLLNVVLFALFLLGVCLIFVSGGKTLKKIILFLAICVLNSVGGFLVGLILIGFGGDTTRFSVGIYDLILGFVAGLTLALSIHLQSKFFSERFLMVFYTSSFIGLLAIGIMIFYFAKAVLDVIFVL